MPQAATRLGRYVGVASALLATVLVVVSVLALHYRRRKRQLERELTELRAPAETPAPLSDRQAFVEQLDIELLRGDRTGQPTCLVVFGVGSEQAPEERVESQLCDFARGLITTARSIDMSYRIGTNEFALILPDTRARGGLVAARRIEATVLSSGLAPAGLTAGVAEVGPGIDRHQLFRNAYCALLAAGRDGRSAVLAYSPELLPSAEIGLAGLAEIEPVDGSAA